MLDIADIALLIIVLLVLLSSQLVCAFKLRRDWRRVQKYKLYKVRDDLIRLVATNLLKEDDFVFKSMYDAVSYFIQKTDTITLRNFIAAMSDAGKRGLDVSQKEKLQSIHAALKTKDPQVTAAVTGFYEAMMLIMVENSRMLRFYLLGGTLLRGIKQALPRKLRTLYWSVLASHRHFNEFCKGLSFQNCDVVEIYERFSKWPDTRVRARSRLGLRYRY